MNVVHYTEIVLEKLRSEQFKSRFLALPNHKEAVVSLVSTVLRNYGGLDACDFGHLPEKVIHHILSAAATPC